MQHVVYKNSLFEFTRTDLTMCFVFLCIGSGVWLQQQNTYIQVEERQDIQLTEDRVVTCVSSKGVVNSANWYFLGEVATGEGMRVSDMIERY